MRWVIAATVAGCRGAGGAGDVPADRGGDADTDADSDSDADADTDGAWLTVSGNRILLPDGSPFHGRGANLQDTRSCWACSWDPPDPGEVERRGDELVDVWGANFVRLTLQSDAEPQPYELQWQGVLDDPGYLADVEEIVRHLEGRGVYVLLSEWADPTFTQLGWPGPGTRDEWALLASEFADDDRVLFGLCNEPQYNDDGSMDPDVWTAMNDAVQTIRDVEDSLGAHHHVITVQGTGGWSRYLSYYVDHPITAGGGDAVAYEIHLYDPASDYDRLLARPAAALPIVIGEYGPSNYSGYDDADALWTLARSLGTPYLAWTFHPDCAPNLLQDQGQGCGVGMALVASEWGRRVQAELAKPW